jgi:hypothetical protein
VAGIASDAGLEALILSDVGSTARITLNRPDKRNALSLELMDELTRVLKTLGAPPMSVRWWVTAKARKPGALRALIHKGGLRADLLSDGEIRVGNQITAR